MLLPTEKPPDENYFQIEKIVQTRYNKKKKQEEYLVKYLHYPAKFNKWVSADDMQEGDNDSS